MKQHLSKSLAIGLILATSLTACAPASRQSAAVKALAKGNLAIEKQSAEDYTNLISNTAPPKQESLQAALRTFTKTTASQLLKEEKNPAENFVYMPLSYYMDLSMLYEASHGEDRKLLEQAIKQGNTLSDEELQLAMADVYKRYNAHSEELGAKLSLQNSIWLKDPVNLTDTYSEIIKNTYHADVYTWQKGSEDTARKEMVKWMKEKSFDFLSEEQFPKTIPNKDAIMYLMNVFYYKSAWSNKFVEEATERGKFKTLDKQEVDSQFMQMTEDGRAIVTDDFILAEKKMADGSSMRFLLPNEGVDYKKLEQENSFWQSLNARVLDSDDYDITWKIPKMDIQSSPKDILSTLDALGIGKIQDSIDLSEGITGNTNSLAVSHISQSTRIEFNEEGAETAAMTIIGITESAAPMEKSKIEVTLDRPFYISQIGSGGEVLMFAYIANPGSAQ